MTEAAPAGAPPLLIEVARGGLVESRRLDALDDAARGALQGHVAPVLRNHAGTEVGALRPGPGWLDA